MLADRGFPIIFEISEIDDPDCEIFENYPRMECHWKEAPVGLFGVALMIADDVRPLGMPASPAVAFGDDADEIVREFVERIDLTGAFAPLREIVSLETGSDFYCFVLAPLDAPTDRTLSC